MLSIDVNLRCVRINWHPRCHRVNIMSGDGQADRIGRNKHTDAVIWYHFFAQHYNGEVTMHFSIWLFIDKDA